MSSAFRSFRFANYRLWFAGATVSNIGTWMQRTAQDWIVLTQLSDDDATALGVTMALQFAPQLLLVPVTGLIADRVDRRKLMLATQSFMGILGLALGVLTLTGAVQLWMVWGFALLLGIGSAFDAPVRQSFVSELVPAPFLSNAVGLNATSFNAARLVGPAVAGLLTAAVGAGWVFLINAVTFAATIAMLLALREDELSPQPRARREPGAIRAGFRYVWRRPDLRVLFVMVFLMGTLGLNFALFASTMASIAFHRGAGEFGILSSAFALGSVVGALLAARRERPRLRSVVLAAAGFGFALIAAALMPDYLAFGAVLPLVGLTSITMLNNANAYVQTTTDPRMRGRVMSLYMAVLMGGTPLGAPLVGWVANTFGPRWGLGIGALGGLVAAGVAGVWWLRRNEVHLRWDRGRRWRVALDAAPLPRRAALATTELAITEAQAARG
ncbi:MAG: MFS transporter [Micrococcales bacterium]|nr:MFS transporter [Micrococcales bacterium]